MKFDVVNKSASVVALNPTRIEPGKIYTFSVTGNARPNCFVHLPPDFKADSPVVVAVHGITRNPLEQMIHLAPWANKSGAVLIAPIFPTRPYRGYQQLLCKDNQSRADHFFDQILAELNGCLGLKTEKLRLFGFSGGGQFVHRYAMAYPGKVEAAAIASAGWYTYPDPALAYPLGIGSNDRLEVVNFDPTSFLRIRFLTLVGTLDTKRDKSLNQSAEICSIQGDTRIERARRWVTAMNACAKEKGISQQSRLLEIPGVGHSFKDCATRGDLGQTVLRFLMSS